MFKKLPFNRPLPPSKKAGLGQKGFTLVELLIGAFISLLVMTAAFEFFVKQKNQLNAQAEVSNLQQNARASLEEMVNTIRYAGAVMPAGIQPIVGRNSNPDTVYVRYNPTGASVEVGQNTSGSGANPIRVAKSIDITCFSIGERILFYHRATGQTEAFNVTNLDTTGVSWNEISHSSQNLAADPQAGDTVLAFQQVKYWVDGSVPQHPRLMRKINAGPDEIFAEDIGDLQFVYTLSTGGTTDAPLATQVVKSVTMTLTGNTQNKDIDFKANSGYRTRTFSTVIYLRNS